MVKAHDFIKIPGENKLVIDCTECLSLYLVSSIPKKMSETIDDMFAFTLLTDSVLQLIKVDSRPELNEVSVVFN